MHSLVCSKKTRGSGDSQVTVNLITVKDTVDAMNTEDDWYRKRYKEVISAPEKYTQWKVLDGQLYFLRPKPVESEIVEDLDRWKLVLPKELHREALRESHSSDGSPRYRKDVSAYCR